MKENKLRRLLNENKPMLSTRLWSTWPFYTEMVGATHNFDYIEFVGEYAPFTQMDLENIARAAELHDMGSMIKLDFLNRGYYAQKAIASGFQAIMFTDCRNAQQVRESVNMVKPETIQDGGSFGFPNRRFIGTQPYMDQTLHAERLRETVLCFMIEKHEAMENIEEICAEPGVDMVQFGPSDFSMSLGKNRSQFGEEIRAAERKMIEVALKHNVKPRCEIPTIEDAQYYIDLGVTCFSLSDQVARLRAFWEGDGAKMRAIADGIARK